jgi:hypothetical protein
MRHVVLEVISCSSDEVFESGGGLGTEKHSGKRLEDYVATGRAVGNGRAGIARVALDGRVPSLW